MAIVKFGDDELAVKVYNPVTKTPIVTYTNYADASTNMKVDASTIRRRCISKKQVYSPLHQMDVAVRLVSSSNQNISK